MIDATTRRPNPIDIHVGSRVRLRRQLLRMSQETLGEELGVTFQQVQKYEKGTNRIGASRLWHIAEIMAVSIQFFFDGIEHEAPNMIRGVSENNQIGIVYDFINSPDGVALASAFSKIKDPKIRRKILDLVKALSEGKEDTDLDRIDTF